MNQFSNKTIWFLFIFITFLGITDCSEISSYYNHSKLIRHQYLSETERIFNEIYRDGVWGKDEYGQGTSGDGSTLQHGLPYIKYVQEFLDNHEITSIVDIGCGDWVLGNKINWGTRNYIGIDIVDGLVKKNTALHGSNTISFIHLNAAEDSLPTGDLLICKDVLMHLPFHEIFKILTKSKQFKYCIFINDIDPLKISVNNNIKTGKFRYLNLMNEPFNLVPDKVTSYIAGKTLKQVLLIIN